MSRQQPLFPQHDSSSPQALRLDRVVSGGQTGVDRAALDAAIALGVAHGGWCPRGRLAEDGRIPSRYHLKETPAREYAVRTEQNVIDSDGTLVLYCGELSGGTELTYRLTVKHRRPCLRVNLDKDPPPQDVVDWLAEHAIATLNVAGPRESNCPGIAAQTRQFFEQVLGLVQRLKGSC